MIDNSDLLTTHCYRISWVAYSTGVRHPSIFVLGPAIHDILLLGKIPTKTRQAIRSFLIRGVSIRPTGNLTLYTVLQTYNQSSLNVLLQGT